MPPGVVEECSLILPESQLGRVTCRPAHLHPLLLVSRTSSPSPPSALLLPHSPFPASRSASSLAIVTLFVNPCPYGPSPLPGLRVTSIEGARQLVCTRWEKGRWEVVDVGMVDADESHETRHDVTRGVLSRVYLYLFTDSVATAHTPSHLPPSASLSSETSHPPCWMNRRTPHLVHPILPRLMHHIPPSLCPGSTHQWEGMRSKPKDRSSRDARWHNSGGTSGVGGEGVRRHNLGRWGRVKGAARNPVTEGRGERAVRDPSSKGRLGRG